MICRILEKRKYCDGGKSTFKVLSPFTCLSPVLLFDIVSGHVSNCFFGVEHIFHARQNGFKNGWDLYYIHCIKKNTNFHSLVQFVLSKREATLPKENRGPMNYW